MRCAVLAAWVAAASAQSCSGGPYEFDDFGYPWETVNIDPLRTPTGTPQYASVGCSTTLCPHDFSACSAKMNGETCTAGVDWACNDGWQAVGTFTLVCDAMNKYNLSQTKCVPNTCQAGPIAVGGTLQYSLRTAAGPTATPDTNLVSFAFCTGLKSGHACNHQQELFVSDGYTCIPGWRANTNFELVCDNNGFYAADKADCLENNCGLGPYPQWLPEHTTEALFGGCNGKTTGDTCAPGEWSCNPGYTATGTIQIVCGDSFHYNTTGASCVPNACTTPTNVPANTDAASFTACNLRTGDTCTGYTCSMGFSPSSPFVMNCDASGNYDASAAQCGENMCTGGPVVTSIPTGATVDSFAECSKMKNGDTCSNIQCDAGHTLSGTLALVCSASTRVYTVSGITCTPDSCAAGPIAATIPANTAAGMFSNCTALTTGESCVYSCNAGYVPTNLLGLSCTAAGFDASSATCVVDNGNSCYRGAFDIPEFTYTSSFESCNAMQTGQSCSTYECEPGYSAGAALSLECVDGWYNASAAECTPNTCSAGPVNAVNLTGVDHSGCNTLQTKFLCGIANYSCPTGYKPEREFFLTCAADGTYYSNAKCLGEMCTQGPLDAPSGMDTSACNNLRTGDVCPASYITCANGEIATGQLTMSCHGGSYSVSGASCIPAPCNDAQHCNGRGTATPSVLNNGQMCDCACISGWGGLTCTVCESPNPQCLECTSAVNCNGNAKTVVKVGAACTCTCADQWTGDTCAVCPAQFTGVACNDCAEGRADYPTCGICSNANSCNNRAERAIPSASKDRCICEECSNQWTGLMCESCPVQFTGASCDQCAAGRYGYPKCELCSTSGHCSDHATSVAVSSDGQQCVCTCESNWSGADCSECPPQFSVPTRDMCTGCAVGHFGSQCTECTNVTHCSSRANSVTSNNARDACVCDCMHGWSGASCNVCPTGFDAAKGCMECAAGYYAYPACFPCDMQTQCNGRATAISSSTDFDSCVCTCKDQWTGVACETCPSGYNSECNQCATGAVGYPDNCTACNSHTHCNGRAAVSVLPNSAQTECVCGTCIDQWQGNQCEQCSAPFDTAQGCKQCLDGYVRYPFCEQCTVSSHCSDRAVSVDSNADRSQCVCNCTQQWQGTTCNECPMQFDAETCSKCKSGYIKYPECTACSALSCSNHGSHNGSDPTGQKCLCDCRNSWTGDTCETCPSIYAGVDCNTCRDPSTSYPACVPAPGSNDTSAPPTPSPPGMTIAPETPSPPVDPCANVVCVAMDQCHEVGVCDPLTKQCSNPNSANTKQCNDGNSSTVSDTCVSGVCVGATPCGSVTCTVTTEPHCQEAVCIGIGSAGECSTRKLSNKQCDDGKTWTQNDQCVDGKCVGEQVPCTVAPTITNGLVRCATQGAVDDTCVVEPISSLYECNGTVICSKEKAPFYSSTAQCFVSTKCTLPATPAGVVYVGTSCNAGSLLPENSECRAKCAPGYASTSADDVLLKCTGTPTISLSSFITCFPAACTSAPPTVTGAAVNCQATTPHAALCTMSSSNGYQCTGQVSCMFGKYESTVACTESECRNADAPVITNAVASCENGFSCRIIPDVGYQCTGDATCRNGAYVSTVQCSEYRCVADQFVVNGSCWACEEGTTRTAGDNPAAGDTSCTPTTQWTTAYRVRSITVTPAVTSSGFAYPATGDNAFVMPCAQIDSAIMDNTLSRVFRMDMGTTRDYFKISPTSSACEVLQGLSIPFWGPDYNGPWEQLETSGMFIMGGFPLNGSTLVQEYDTRTTVGAWGTSQALAAGCCAETYSTAIDIAASDNWGVSYEMHFLHSTGTPTPQAPETPTPGKKDKVFRIRYRVKLALFSLRAFRAAMDELMSAISRLISFFEVLRACPASVCENGECPEKRTESLARGCQLPGMFAEGRAADVLEDEDTYVDFDMIPVRTASEAGVDLDVVKQQLMETLDGHLAANNGSFPFVGLTTQDRLIEDDPVPSPGGSDDDLWAWLLPLLIAVGVILCCLVCILVFLCCRKGEEKEEEHNKEVELESNTMNTMNTVDKPETQMMYPVQPQEGVYDANAYPAQNVYQPQQNGQWGGDGGAAGGYDSPRMSAVDSIGPSASQVSPTVDRPVDVNPIEQVFHPQANNTAGGPVVL